MSAAQLISEIIRGYMRICMLMVLVILSGMAHAASVREQGGNIYYVGDDGVSRQLTSLHSDKEPLLSPDGKKVAFNRVKQKSGVNEEAQPNEIWLSDIYGKAPRRIVVARPDNNPERNLTQLNSWVFSTDSKHLYFLTAAWVTSNALHVLDLATGKEHFVTDANDVRVIARGRYKNHPVVMKHKYFKLGGSYDYYWLITPEGKEIKMVGKDEKQAKRFIGSKY